MYADINEIEKNYEVKDFPLNIAIEPSNYCNLNCVMCANDKLTRPRGKINILLYKKLIDEIAVENPHARIWLDFYGEPLLQKFRLFYMINYAKKKGLSNICFNTNATLLNQEMTEMILDSGLDFISIDCDGFSKEIYEKIRVNANRDVTYANIEYFLKHREERGLKKPIVEVKIMEMEENAQEVNTVVKYWRDRGAWTTVRRLISWGGMVNNISPKAQENRVACGTAVGIMIITWDGKVANCAMDADAKYVYGDTNVESIKSIWKRRNETMVRKHIEHRFDELPEICRNCTDWMIIGEQRFDENGNPIEKSYQHDESMLSAADA